MSWNIRARALVGVLATALVLGAPALAGAVPADAAATPTTAPSSAAEGAPRGAPTSTTTAPSSAAESIATAPAVADATTTSPAIAASQASAQADDRVCSDAPAGHASCLLEVDPDAAIPAGTADTATPSDTGTATPAGTADTATPALSGYGLEPSDLRAAYGLSAVTGSSSATIAVVDAFDAPTIESDLAAYRAQYGLGSCTIASGCLTKLSQTGSTTGLPATNLKWAQESTADLEMASAICPQCSLMIVEARSSSVADLGTAVNTAVEHGAKYVSNSYGSAIPGSTTAYDTSYYRHAGVVMTAAAGDTGYGASYPASSPWVTAVGGTTLSFTNGAWVQQAWSGTGSGCGTSAKPAWQSDGLCPGRTMTDVSAAASGIALYLPGATTSGWTTGSGTSLSSPIVAAVYALAGTPAAGTYPAQYPYQHVAALHDVTTGTNGSCGGTALCTAGVGYDGPTGLGTPNGVAAFRASTLSVTQVAGTDAYDTAARTADLGGYPAGLDRVYVATRSGFADALAGGAAAGVSGSPILLVTRDSIPSETATELGALQPRQIVVLGGPVAVSDQVASSLAQYATDADPTQRVLRDAGADRWATSAAVSADAFPDGASTVYIATGVNFPDALSGAAMAATAANRGPILLVPGTSIPDSVTAELRRLATSATPIGRIVVLGGTTVVSAAVQTQLAQYAPVTRLSGGSRFETSTAVSRATYASTSTVYVATGTNFPDALAGAPVAARNGAPILLVFPTQTPAAIQAEIDRLGATRVVVLGGTAAVGAGALATL